MRRSAYFLLCLLYYISPRVGSGQNCTGLITPDFSFTQSACSPQTINFFLDTIQSIQSYTWNFGNNTTASNIPDPTVTYQAYNVYTVKLHIVYANGCTDSVVKQFPILNISDSFIINRDTAICLGDSVYLNTSSNGRDSCWLPSPTLFHTANGRVVAKPVTTSTYVFKSTVISDNLASTGNFSAGNSGFSSDYEYDPVSGFWEGTYNVLANASLWHRDFLNCGDHTSGTGKMMVINGSKYPNVRVWYKTVNVVPNSNYLFSTWLVTLNPSNPVNPAQLQFSINGHLLDSSFVASTTTCNWRQYSTSWNSGSNTMATIEIMNMNTVDWGNDFALDDIYFGRQTLKTDSITVAVKTPRIVDTAVTICSGSTYTLPSGVVLNTAGLYSDTSRYALGCDSIITRLRLNIGVIQYENITDTICQGGQYVLPSGATINQSGIYKDTIRYTAGCDSVIFNINLQVRPVVTVIKNVFLCDGQTYTLPTGIIVNSNGIYSDTVRYMQSSCDSLRSQVNVHAGTYRKDSLVKICTGNIFYLPSGIGVTATGNYADTIRSSAGCDSIITTFSITYIPLSTNNITAQICQGSTYILPSGISVNSPGIYRDTIRSIGGCDSLITVVQLTMQPVIFQVISAVICQGQSFILPSGLVITGAGNYRDTIKYASGCDSLVTTASITLKNLFRNNIAVTLCAGQHYTLPSGISVGSSGLYNDTIRYAAGCDSLISMVQVNILPVYVDNYSRNICTGQTVILPSGQLVSSAGLFRDTVRYISGCDSLISNISISINATRRIDTTITLCAGQSFTLPSGIIINTGGLYRDTLRSAYGCDSIISAIFIRLQSPLHTAQNVQLCAGQSFTMPGGRVVNTSGLYKDTLYYHSGCDSLITTLQVMVYPVNNVSLDVSLCNGQSYTMPSGIICYTTGLYRDTLRYSNGCDSLRTSINLTITTVINRDTSIVLCSGQTYHAPSGRIITSNGFFRDTLRSNNGCDSLITNISSTTLIKTYVQQSANICEGQPYILPTGTPAFISGVYRDTLRYTRGCDSVIIVTTLLVIPVKRMAVADTICAGQTYTLPSGIIVNAGNMYIDTIRYTNGCDSLITTVRLVVQPLTQVNLVVTICSGQTYMLPSGRPVNATGIYHDTLRYSSGCDSLATTIQLQVKPVIITNKVVTICFGQNYILPSGLSVVNSGTYQDTMRYSMGCDSLITNVLLTVKNKIIRNVTVRICSGQSYATPSGQVLTTAGLYNDTILYISGCDSLITSIQLTMQPVSMYMQTVSICAGNSFVLPNGLSVSVGGVYSDTLKYASGCDSVIRKILLNVKPVVFKTIHQTLCAGQTYQSEAGRVYNASGIYKDTLYYQSGCDSIISTVQLVIKPVVRQAINITVCQGSGYMLPSGTMLTLPGNYRDTVRYASGCDSLLTQVALTVTSVNRITSSIVMCQGENYMLPWGKIANNDGTYCDTLRTSMGCDSLITMIVIKYRQAPVVKIIKSNDVNCMLGSATLSANTGGRFLWKSAANIAHSQRQSIVVSPSVNTMYTLQVTGANGCIGRDSIWVKVDKSNTEGGYILPGAFTPNNDGKNDCFGVNSWGRITNLNFTIYNRWGQVVFNTTEAGKCWDGTLKGEKQGSAAFVYIITATTNCGPVFRKGTVVLIR